MKKYMMLFVGVDYQELGLSPEESQDRMGKWFAWNQKMQETGIIESGEALTKDVTRISGKNKTVTDRVTVETKELISGYYVFTAENLDAAKEIVASGYPDFDLGGNVELREVMVF